MEDLLPLAEGDQGVREGGYIEYFEGFYDSFDQHHRPPTHENSAISESELEALLELAKLVDIAADATDAVESDDELIRSGWPVRVQPIARAVLSQMLERGRFREDVEETRPSCRDGWPWREI